MALAKSFFYVTSNFKFIYFAFIVFSSWLVYSNKASEIRRPRGVSISKASLYIPDKEFICFDGSFTIPFSQVNDDYCDCEDGSDEPGTSACSNGYFHCTNAGFKPLNIPSSQVNDGFCDCCDGADEYLGKIKCENNCQELGKAEILEAQKQAKILKMGYQAKIEAIERGKHLKREKRERLQELESDKQRVEDMKADKEKLKMDAESLEKLALEQFHRELEAEKERLQEEENKSSEQEAIEVFTLLDSNRDNILDKSELRARQTFDQNKDGIVSDEELFFFFGEADDMDWNLFFTEGWPKMKPFFMMEKGLFRPPERNFSLTDEYEDGVGTVEDVTDEYHKERQKAEEDAEHDEDEGEEEEEEEEEPEPPQPPELDDKTESPPQYDEETQKIVDAANEARSQFEEADRALRDIQRQISQHQEYLEKDFGPDEEFAPLEGECFEYTDREYVYKLCPFDLASQQPRSGESETRLGQWGKWVGPEDDRYQAMLYDRGQSCWNGPQRSVIVNLRCGVENELVSVSEPNKCEYRFEFNTPSACKMVEEFEEKVHDEL